MPMELDSMSSELLLQELKMQELNNSGLSRAVHVMTNYSTAIGKITRNRLIAQTLHDTVLA